MCVCVTWCVWLLFGRRRCRGRRGLVDDVVLAERAGVLEFQPGIHTAFVELMSA